jgi:hypothetical protein
MTSGESRHPIVDNYIVRIYGRGRRDPAGLDGVVEIVEGGTQIAFHGCEELWNILMRDAHGDPSGGA